MAHTKLDYDDMGDYFHLDYLGVDPPPLSHARVLWRCRRCHRVFERSYRQLRRRKTEGRPGCRCGGRQALKVEDYRRLATRLGITWIGSHLPPTSRARTEWKSSQGILRASYRELSQAVPSRLSQFFPDIDSETLDSQ